MAIWGAGALILLTLGGCAALRGEDGVDAQSDYNPNLDGYDYYDDIDDYYYEYMGY